MGNELGVESRDWESSHVKWVLTYPDLYEVGASNLGHIILYSILNSVPNQLCDRTYLPAPDFAKRLRELSQELFAVESRKPLVSFDIVGFSLSYELAATNILEMLDLANIPIYSEDRKNLPINDDCFIPLIFAGGPTATSNPEPYAAFFDFFAIGDGEELLPEIGLIFSEAKKENLTRLSVLKELSEIPGVYVPSIHKPIINESPNESLEIRQAKKIIRRVATPMPHYATGLVSNIETVHDRLTIEIRRGCTRGCRFCQPGMLTRPARDVDPKEVISAVEIGMEKTGYSDFSLLSLSCSDYLALPSVGVELRNRLADKNITLQLPSQRVDRFDENIAHILGGSRQAGLTFAPEAGTQRLRDIVNKGLTDEELLNGIRKAMESGYQKVKLYFMIGLPGERDEDVLGIANTCEWLQKQCLDLGRLKLNITISNFTPKPHTPFQWHSVSKTEFEHKQKILREAFKSLKGIKGNFTDIRISAIEDFIGRGDSQLASVIETAWKAGAGMDAWFESLDRAYTAWKSAISAAGLEGQYRKLEMGNWSSVKALNKDDLKKFCSKPLPWDHIDTGIEKKWLAQDLQRALSSIVLPDCSFSSCSSCGVCGPDMGHNVVIEPPPIPYKKNQIPPPIEKVCRIRIRFEKTTPMHLLSHLDLMRLLERALRRSKLPVSFSGGFHPLPRIQIALALPLGIEALGELMDIDFFKEVDASFVKEELQKKLPFGLKIITCENTPFSKKSLSQLLKEAVWSFNLESKYEPYPSRYEWDIALSEIINSEKLIWKDTDKKGRLRERDCREALDSLEIIDKYSQESELNQTKNISLKLKARIDQMGRSLKPNQIQHWLSEYLGQELMISGIKRNELVLFKC